MAKPHESRVIRSLVLKFNCPTCSSGPLLLGKSTQSKNVLRVPMRCPDCPFSGQMSLTWLLMPEGKGSTGGDRITAPGPR